MKYVICAAVHSLLEGNHTVQTKDVAKYLCQKLLNSTMRSTYELPAEKISAE
jgi:hypothetical protein